MGYLSKVSTVVLSVFVSKSGLASESTTTTNSSDMKSSGSSFIGENTKTRTVSTSEEFDWDTFAMKMNPFHLIRAERGNGQAHVQNQ